MGNTKGKKAPVTQDILQENVQKIVQLEHEALEGRSFGERVGDAVARFAGNIIFVILHVFWFVGWIVLNSGRVHYIRPFDPPPYMLLSFIVSLEAIFLTSFVLMSQNRMSRQADYRAHLDLQINLLTEQESTKILQMLQNLCDRLGLRNEVSDQEVKTLLERTEPEKLIDELKKSLPNE